MKANIMEIDITSFFESANAFDFSASAAELGQDAARITWANAQQQASEQVLLTTSEQLDALRAWARSSGGWTAKEIATWSDNDCNALFIQIISGDKRELEALCTGDDGDIDWTAAEAMSNEGRIGGCLYRGDSGRVYYYLGE